MTKEQPIDGYSNYCMVFQNKIVMLLLENCLYTMQPTIIKIIFDSACVPKVHLKLESVSGFDDKIITVKQLISDWR